MAPNDQKREDTMSVCDDCGKVVLIVFDAGDDVDGPVAYCADCYDRKMHVTATETV